MKIYRHDEKKILKEFQDYATFSIISTSLLKRQAMKRILYGLLLIFLMISCSSEIMNIRRDLNNRIGVVQFHGCFCGPSAYRYLIETQDAHDTLLFNPINLPENFKVNGLKVFYTAGLLKDSSIVYTNTPTDGLIEDFKVRNIKLSSIRMFSNQILNEPIVIYYGEMVKSLDNSLSIKLDSVTEESRCPYNVECFSAGNATVKFDFTLNDKLSTILLNTSSGFRTDTIISGFRIQLIELKPYSVNTDPVLQKEYRAVIKISG